MSILLPETRIDHPRKEVISATHEEVISADSLKESLKGGSCWSSSDQSSRPLFMVHGDSKEGQGNRREFTPNSEEVQTGTLKSDYEQQLWKDSESDYAITKPGCEEQQVWEESFVDELVCKLVSQFCFLPETSIAYAPDRGFKELSLQDDAIIQNFQTSDSCLDGDTSKHVLSPDSSLEAPSPSVEKSKGLVPQDLGEVAVLSTEYSDAPAKFKSALRGGYEKSGLGPRSKVHVSWAPDVYDPPCTSTSHTCSKNHRRHHHHPKSDHKSRHKGKGSNQADTQKKSQKKMLRRLRHTGETFLSVPAVVPHRGTQNNTLLLKEYIAPSFDDLTLKSARVSPFILPPKGCFLNPVLSLGERELVTLEKIQGCHPRHVQTHKLFW